MPPDIIQQYPFNRAGNGETSLMLALCSETLDISKHNAENWYAKDATEVSVELGAKGRGLVLAEMRKVLGAW